MKSSLAILSFIFLVLNQNVQGQILASVEIVPTDAKQAVTACFGVFVTNRHILMPATCATAISEMTMSIKSTETSDNEEAKQLRKNLDEFTEV